jgi:hypothetical protein
MALPYYCPESADVWPEEGLGLITGNACLRILCKSIIRPSYASQLCACHMFPNQAELPIDHGMTMYSPCSANEAAEP